MGPASTSTRTRHTPCKPHFYETASVVGWEPCQPRVDHGFDPLSGQTKDYEIAFCCFSAKHTVFKRNNTDWIVRNQDNVSAWNLSANCCFSELAL